jgi:hypothetical protein
LRSAGKLRGRGQGEDSVAVVQEQLRATSGGVEGIGTRIGKHQVQVAVVVDVAEGRAEGVERDHREPARGLVGEDAVPIVDQDAGLVAEGIGEDQVLVAVVIDVTGEHALAVLDEAGRQPCRGLVLERGQAAHHAVVDEQRGRQRRARAREADAIREQDVLESIAVGVEGDHSLGPHGRTGQETVLHLELLGVE